jgi:hypothetical protein
MAWRPAGSSRSQTSSDQNSSASLYPAADSLFQLNLGPDVDPCLPQVAEPRPRLLRACDHVAAKVMNSRRFISVSRPDAVSGSVGNLLAQVQVRCLLRSIASL